MKPSITAKFADWVEQRVLEALPAELKSLPVLDERKKDLKQNIQKSIASGLQACVALSAPAMQKDGDSSFGNTQFRVQVEVALMSNFVLNKAFNSYELAEHLFRSFVGAEFMSGPVCAYDVGVDSLSTMPEGSKVMHTFSVYTVVTL